ncbi:MAG TPA: zinc ribbon domain-containing protein [Blastocatellia bacterium]
MYCPKCGSQAADSAAYCRSCGANLSLVPQALTGTLARPDKQLDRHGRPKRPKTMTEAITTLFTGFGFIAAAIATLYCAPAGSLWWYWLFIPAFSCIGTGVATMFALRSAQRAASAPQLPPASRPNTAEIGGDEPYKLGAPPSIVEATTRQLDRNRETK